MEQVLRYAERVWPWIATTVALRVVVGVTYVTQAFVLADILTAVLRGEDLADQATAFAVIIGLVVVRALVLYAAQASSANTATATKVAVRDRAFAKVTELGPIHLAGDRTGEVTATVVDGVEALEGYYSRYIPALIAGLLTPLIAIVALFLTDGWLGLVVLAFVLGAIMLPQLWLGALGDRSDERMAAHIALGATVLDTMQGLATLKAFGAGRRKRAEPLERMGDRLITTWISEMAVALVSMAIFAGAVVGGMALVAWIAGVRVADGGLTAKAAFLALVLSAEALRPIAVLAESFHTTYDAGGAARRLDALFALTPPAADTGGDPVTDLGASVAFNDVSFTYPSGEAPAVRGVSLHVDPGETVAVVGPSGAGKSTLATLLVRFADPDSGSVTIGGVDIRALPLDQVRSQVAMVSQHTHLFNGTVRDNLVMARPAATDAEVEDAARSAGAHDFIVAMPDGYDSRVGEGGGRLSGGQRQRVAIARALLADSPILVLDEATASVDNATEAGIQRALDQLRANRTTLIIAHRLSTIRHADRIVVLADGHIVEEGTHDSLLTLDGAYRRLIAAQEVAA